MYTVAQKATPLHLTVPEPARTIFGTTLAVPNTSSSNSIFIDVRRPVKTSWQIQEIIRSRQMCERRAMN